MITVLEAVLVCHEISEGTRQENAMIETNVDCQKTHRTIGSEYSKSGMETRVKIVAEKK